MNPMSWECLDEEEKKEIISLLPPHLVLEEGRPPLEFLNYSTDWQDGLRLFQVDLEAGHYDPEWLKQASQAMEDRAAGEFDSFKEKEFEEYWGQKSRLESHMLSGELSKARLEDLTSAGTFKVGDVWSYARAFGRGKTAILVERDVEVSHAFTPWVTFVYIFSCWRLGLMESSTFSSLQDRESLLAIPAFTLSFGTLSRRGRVPENRGILTNQRIPTLWSLQSTAAQQSLKSVSP